MYSYARRTGGPASTTWAVISRPRRCLWVLGKAGIIFIRPGSSFEDSSSFFSFASFFLETVTHSQAHPSFFFFFMDGEALWVTHTVVHILVFSCVLPSGPDIQIKTVRSERNTRGLSDIGKKIKSWSEIHS